MTDLWNPKVGELVKYVAISAISGKLVNIRAETVTKVTDKYIHAGRADHKYVRGAPGRCREHVPKKFSSSSTIRSHIEPLAEAEAAVLPRDNLGGSQYARKLNFETQAA
ncbi:hypothetical protein HOU02_gp457 [Caulobacter phage CcrBL9]|uniref:Uncharacterized protein n=1 Tax=Caulobacter phage CcrBL9 TaxID=2283270 RepID=A0A385EES6_9CAUD|nr:hypothetical protein HOU02_gp457 [Caulobacter phage CcrBL9]AXQ69268.1 hypothetical protein CcrBL9_gp244c [Caulobacter phage CcrBL9]